MAHKNPPTYIILYGHTVEKVFQLFRAIFSRDYEGYIPTSVNLIGLTHDMLKVLLLDENGSINLIIANPLVCVEILEKKFYPNCRATKLMQFCPNKPHMDYS